MRTAFQSTSIGRWQVNQVSRRPSWMSDRPPHQQVSLSTTSSQGWWCCSAHAVSGRSSIGLPAAGVAAANTRRPLARPSVATTRASAKSLPSATQVGASAGTCSSWCCCASARIQPVRMPMSSQKRRAAKVDICEIATTRTPALAWGGKPMAVVDQLTEGTGTG